MTLKVIIQRAKKNFFFSSFHHVPRMKKKKFAHTYVSHQRYRMRRSRRVLVVFSLFLTFLILKNDQDQKVPLETLHLWVQDLLLLQSSDKIINDDGWTRKMDRDDVIQQLLQLRNGIPIGKSWKFFYGGGSLFGTVDRNGNITDDEGIYFYPDHRTALIGKFKNDIMIDAELAQLSRLVLISSNIWEPRVTKTRQINDKYRYEPSNDTYIPNPLQRDPYEDQYLYVSKSKVVEAGRGVFMSRSATNGTVVGFYQGVRMSRMTAKLNKSVRKSQYKVDNQEGEVLDIPSHYRSLNAYNATLGHLINHSQKPNAYFSPINHPRFGPIQSVVLLRDVKPDEELYVDYGYIDDYMNHLNSISTILKLGRWVSDSKTEEEYHQDLKRHIRYIRDNIHSYRPYLNVIQAGFNFFENNL